MYRTLSPSLFLFLLISSATAFNSFGAIPHGALRSPNFNTTTNNTVKAPTNSSFNSTNNNTTHHPVGQLRVTENSGICETTPGVYQASGYGQIIPNESVWFWYFNARKNPETAPLALWFNGGPGSSSMLGLFLELGPCLLHNITSDPSALLPVHHNPFSWNKEVNLLFIDQPIGAGLSYGNIHVNSTKDAAVDVWLFLQIFFKDKRFKWLKDKEVGLWTESYGGHYGPAFSSYILSQNSLISKGDIRGQHINLQYLGIGDGLTDPLAQYPQYLNYAASNPYHPLVNQSVLIQAKKDLEGPDGCKELIKRCNQEQTDTICMRGQDVCNSKILIPLRGIYDYYFINSLSPDPYPNIAGLTPYMASIADKIGAETEWTPGSNEVSDNFFSTGDWVRTSTPDLEKVIDSGIRTHIYCGDVDYILNYKGIEAMIAGLETKYSKQFNSEKFQTYTVRGQPTGLYKNAGKFSYLRVFGAGHAVPAYRHGTLEYGEAAFQMFSQVMRHGELKST